MAWLPLLFVGAMLFWTVALGLGGWSFMLVNDRGTDGDMDAVAPVPTATATEPMPGGDTAGPTGGSPSGGSIAGSVAIPVQMQESDESEDVDDNAGAVHSLEAGLGKD